MEDFEFTPEITNQPSIRNIPDGTYVVEVKDVKYVEAYPRGPEAGLPGLTLKAFIVSDDYETNGSWFYFDIPLKGRKFVNPNNQKPGSTDGIIANMIRAFLPGWSQGAPIKTSDFLGKKIHADVTFYMRSNGQRSAYPRLKNVRPYVEAGSIPADIQFEQ